MVLSVVIGNKYHKNIYISNLIYPQRRDLYKYDLKNCKFTLQSVRSFVFLCGWGVGSMDMIAHKVRYISLGILGIISKSNHNSWWVVKGEKKWSNSSYKERSYKQASLNWIFWHLKSNSKDFNSQLL